MGGSLLGLVASSGPTTQSESHSSPSPSHSFSRDDRAPSAVKWEPMQLGRAWLTTGERQYSMRLKLHLPVLCRASRCNVQTLHCLMPVDTKKDIAHQWRRLHWWAKCLPGTAHPAKLICLNKASPASSCENVLKRRGLEELYLQPKKNWTHCLTSHVC